MTSHAKQPIAKGTVEAILEDTVSEEEMDRLLASRHDEIGAMLEEAHQDRARGDFAPLEPLQVFLREARERFNAKR
ncbi:hypothetical protein D3874_11000 [Oleomonas cavernae]|uniref:Uncharacterized protein n=1 Tax=Oleomonas cavernae TaxID=2320859 RepID=A0A418WBU7_9PROT|nr:hypothetical protein [Oleomonas cavernae]RJF87479.1 hypothetical protein D3874_11000 [Oleomonas cavernae]